MPVADSKYDRDTRKLTGTTDHFSYYGEQANPTISGPGRVMAYQVDLHSGAATYSYPIELPPGQGGFTPSLTLNYNSGVADAMKNKHNPRLSKSAYGGEKWSPRTLSHREEIGSMWGDCGLNSEWAPLKQVLLHPPGPELSVADPESRNDQKHRTDEYNKTCQSCEGWQVYSFNPLYWGGRKGKPAGRDPPVFLF